MSEEKPTFKITDRRLFNADGTPREDVEREETPIASSVAAGESTGRSAAGPSSSSTSSPSSAPPSEAAATRREAAAPAPTDEAAEEDFYGAGDAAPFVNLVMFIASPAAAALGITEHPATGAREVDLPLAKHCIDLLGTLQEKTRGRLSLQEQQTLDGLLTELRMQYVSLTGARPAPGAPRRGFTGSDITGGR